MSVRRALLEKAAKYAELKARAYAPVRTGRLRANIRGTTGATGTGRTTTQGGRVFLSAPYEYAPVEFGSIRGHNAQRFLERAMNDALEWMTRRAEREIEDLILRGRVGHISKVGIAIGNPGHRFSGKVF